MAEPVKVVGLFGQPVITGEVNENAVNLAEELLQKTKSGDIVGIAYAALHRDETTSGSWAGIMHFRKIVGMIESLKYLLVKKDVESDH